MAATAPMPLVSLFTEVEDPRRPQARRNTLEDILLIATLAVICGADRGTEVELFGRQKQAWLETFLALPHGIPSHDTFGRVFARLDPQQLEICFTRWVRSLAVALQDQGNRILIGQDLEQVAVVPAGLLALGGDAALGRGLAAQQIEGQSAQD